MANHDGSHGFAKGKVDPREAGRAGGVASGAVRRGERPSAQLREQIAELERKAAESGNGYVALRMLDRLERRTQAGARESAAAAEPKVRHDPDEIFERLEQVGLLVRVNNPASIAKVLRSLPEQTLAEVLRELGHDVEVTA